MYGRGNWALLATCHVAHSVQVPQRDASNSDQPLPPPVSRSGIRPQGESWSNGQPQSLGDGLLWAPPEGENSQTRQDVHLIGLGMQNPPG